MRLPIVFPSRANRKLPAPMDSQFVTVMSSIGRRVITKLSAPELLQLVTVRPDRMLVS